MPRDPLRLLPERRRRLSGALSERARERLRSVVTAVERDVDDAAIVAKRKRVRGALQAHEPNVFVHADAEQVAELSLEMELRKRRNAAEPVETQVFVRVRIDEVEDATETGEIPIC